VDFQTRTFENSRFANHPIPATIRYATEPVRFVTVDFGTTLQATRACLQNPNFVIRALPSKDLVRMGTSDLIFFKKMKIIFFKFLKESENNIRMQLTIYPANTQENLVQIVCILGHTRITNV
jgi:hypothetical protein